MTIVAINDLIDSLLFKRVMQTQGFTVDKATSNSVTVTCNNITSVKPLESLADVACLLSDMLAYGRVEMDCHRVIVMLNAADGSPNKPFRIGFANATADSGLRSLCRCYLAWKLDSDTIELVGDESNKSLEELQQDVAQRIYDQFDFSGVGITIEQTGHWASPANSDDETDLNINAFGYYSDNDATEDDDDENNLAISFHVTFKRNTQLITDVRALDLAKGQSIGFIDDGLKQFIDRNNQVAVS